MELHFIVYQCVTCSYRQEQQKNYTNLGISCFEQQKRILKWSLFGTKQENVSLEIRYYVLFNILNFVLLDRNPAQQRNGPLAIAITSLGPLTNICSLYYIISTYKRWREGEKKASMIVFYTLINKLPPTPMGNEWKMPFMFYTFPVLVNWFP